MGGWSSVTTQCCFFLALLFSIQELTLKGHLWLTHSVCTCLPFRLISDQLMWKSIRKKQTSAHSRWTFSLSASDALPLCRQETAKLCLQLSGPPKPHSWKASWISTPSVLLFFAAWLRLQSFKVCRGVRRRWNATVVAAVIYSTRRLKVTHEAEWEVLIGAPILLLLR